MVIGDPIEHSLSPQMHNAGYKALGIDNEYVYVAARVKIEHIKQAAEGMRAFNILGMSCTMPHKLEIMKYLNTIDEVAQKIGAVNTVVNEQGKLVGYNTDWLGAVTPIEELTTLKGKKAAVLGAGGAARAIVFGLIERGCSVTVYNRTPEKAQELAQEFTCEAASNENLQAVKKVDIIVNATSLGMHPHATETPLPKEYITNNQIVLDAVYVPYETRFLREAKEQGAQVIHGIDMLLHQGVAQFELFTEQKAPVEEMRKVLIM